MRRGGAIGDMAESISQHPKIQDLPLQFVGFGVQLPTRNIRSTILPEHGGDLDQRETRLLPEADKRQSQENVCIELPPQTMSPKRADQSNFLIVAQRRRRHA